ncbi:hypothetical protein ACOMHN_026063 [Nucella lapillus]
MSRLQTSLRFLRSHDCLAETYLAGPTERASDVIEANFPFSRDHFDQSPVASVFPGWRSNNGVCIFYCEAKRFPFAGTK